LKTKIGKLTCLSPNAGLKLVRYSMDVHATVFENQLHILPRSISVTQIVWTPYKFWKLSRTQSIPEKPWVEKKSLQC